VKLSNCSTYKVYVNLELSIDIVCDKEGTIVIFVIFLPFQQRETRVYYMLLDEDETFDGWNCSPR